MEEFIRLAKSLAQSEKQTWVANFLSDDDNHYAKHAPLYNN